MKSEGSDKILVSACLLGVRCRYDGNNALKTELLKEEIDLLLPVCPEQLGGLSTPRESCEIVGGGGEDVLAGKARVVGRETRTDFTAQFIRGAEETLNLVQRFNCRKAYFKRYSPSCGKGEIKSGDKIVAGAGVTSALLIRNNIEIVEF